MESYNISVVRIAGSDRNIVLFTSAEHNTLKGINFWHGLGDDALMKNFLQPDPAVTDWVLKRLRLVNEEWAEYSIICPDYDELIDNINAAISGYIQHQNTPQQITLPPGQKVHLQHALMLLADHAKQNNLHFTEFDTIVLRELLKYPVTISVTPEEQQNFCWNHGVDFPKYI
jgi:hypothetical protein